MTSQGDLFTYEPSAAKAYPDVPGYRGEKGGTSQKAAESIAPVTNRLQDQALAVLKQRPMTPDEVAAFLGCDRLTIRPRISELISKQLVVKTKARRRNASGKLATVYAAAVPQETRQ